CPHANSVSATSAQSTRRTCLDSAYPLGPCDSIHSSRSGALPKKSRYPTIQFAPRRNNRPASKERSIVERTPQARPCTSQREVAPSRLPLSGFGLTIFHSVGISMLRLGRLCCSRPLGVRR